MSRAGRAVHLIVALGGFAGWLLAPSLAGAADPLDEPVTEVVVLGVTDSGFSRRSVDIDAGSIVRFKSSAVVPVTLAAEPMTPELGEILPGASRDVIFDRDGWYTVSHLPPTDASRRLRVFVHPLGPTDSEPPIGVSDSDPTPVTTPQASVPAGGPEPAVGVASVIPGVGAQAPVDEDPGDYVPAEPPSESAVSATASPSLAGTGAYSGRLLRLAVILSLAGTAFLLANVSERTHSEFSWAYRAPSRRARDHDDLLPGRRARLSEAPRVS